VWVQCSALRSGRVEHRNDRVAGETAIYRLARPDGRVGRRRPVPVRLFVWSFHIGLPVLVLWLLLIRPALDGRWEEHVAHFWLVGFAASINAVLGFRMSEDARRRGDARLFLVAMAFLCSAGFLGLHALATPGVVVSGKNAGFVVATPIGLVLAACFAAASTIEMSPRWSARLLSRQGLLRIGVLAGLVAWGAVSLLRVPPLNHPVADEEAHGPLVVLAVGATVLYLVAATRYYVVHRRRPSVMLLSLITAFFLLAEAMIAISLARTWQASWWEWHVLLVAGYAFVAYSAYVQYRREGSSRGLFDAVSLERTLRDIRAEYGSALESLVSAMDAETRGQTDRPVGVLAARVGEQFELSEGQIRVLERAAEALAHERDQIRRLGSLVAIGEHATVIRQEEELLDHAVALVGDSFGRDRLRLGVLHDGVLQYVAAPVAAADDVAGAPVRETALRTRAPADGSVGDAQLFVVPLMVKRQAVGVLEAVRPHGAFGDQDRALLRSLASQLSMALENARLYHQLDGLFRQYMSPDVATALLADPDQAALGGAIVEVTVLFADLRGFTPFSEHTPPDQVVSVLNDYFGLAVPVILAEGGTVVQFVGDAIMALFNAPVRQPDHALRAARAALAMQEAIEGIAAQHPTWPRFRVGLNTGPALVGNIGSTEMRNFTAIGDTTNLAARLETNAEVGQVLIGSSTYEQIKDIAIVRPVAPLDVKGKTAPVQAYILIAVRTDNEK
jgi:class 3 adenylate cyclase